MRNRPVVFLLTAALVLAALHAPPPVRAQSPAYDIIALVNDLRASLGLPPFAVNGALMAAAQGHAEWMAANLSYTHTGAGGSTPQQRAAAAGYVGFVSENIVGGTNMSPRQGVVWWENSAIHYRTMTSTRHIHVGAGFASNAGQNMYVLVVGVPSDYAPGGGSAAAENEQAKTPIIVVPVTRSEPREDGSIVHEVQMGQTLWDIAAVYDVDLATLININNLPDEPILFPGDNIYVRLPDGATLPPPGPLTHTVQPGQSAWSIAARYGLTLGELLDLNGLPQDAVLRPGDELIIRLAPGQSPPPTRTPTPQPSTHTIQAGDTLWSIAVRYGLTLDDLLALNGLTNDAVIIPGETLIIRATDPPPTETPLPTATTVPSPTASAASLPEAVTEVATITPLPTARALQPSPTPSPAATRVLSPTPTLPPAVASPVRTRNLLIGAAIIGVGVLALLGMAGIELYERFVRRR
ncbi:MAG: hypothetical protein Kow0077_27500 [Anaerolineae bacterium]